MVFRLGRLRSGGAKGPGLFFIMPCVDTYKKVDLRTVSFDVPPQEVRQRGRTDRAVMSSAEAFEVESRPIKGDSRYDVRIRGGGGSWKSAHSEGGCVSYSINQFQMWMRQSTNPKFMWTS